MKRKRKVCPLLVQSDTTPSLTVNGETYTRTYFCHALAKIVWRITRWMDTARSGRATLCCERMESK